MSLHLFLARPGFKDTPIPADDWLAAARGTTALSVHEHKDRVGRVTTSVTLVGGAERLELTRYGLVDAQDPSEALVAVMFELAPRLGAAVYSEHLRQYASIADWERHTRVWRKARAANRAAARRRTRRGWLRMAAIVVVSGVAGWYLSAPR